VAPADVATGGSLAEQYEGVLLQVQSVSVTNVNPDSPDDYDETEVSGLRIDDMCIDGGGEGDLMDNNYTMAQSFTSVTGVLTYGFSHFKLLPRLMSDIVD
jgi:hypothetical protein